MLENPENDAKRNLFVRIIAGTGIGTLRLSMQTLIVGLLLAGVSATTIVAFKHPHGYAKLFPYLIGTALMIFVCVALWHVAVEMTWKGVEEYVAADNLPEAENVLKRLELPYFWIVLWFAVLLAFFWVNLKLPHFLQVTDRD